MIFERTKNKEEGVKLLCSMCNTNMKNKGTKTSGVFSSSFKQTPSCTLDGSVVSNEFRGLIRSLWKDYLSLSPCRLIKIIFKNVLN